MDEKKKEFYNYVDRMHKKNEEVHKLIEINEKIKNGEIKKLEEWEKVRKNNDICINTLDNINKNKELYYYNLKREISIKKKKLLHLNFLLHDIPEIIKKEKEKYQEYKNESYNKIIKIIEAIDDSYDMNNVDDIWDTLKEYKEKTENINYDIQKIYDEITLLHKDYNQCKYKYQDLNELQNNRNNKLKKISATLQFIKNLKQGLNNKINNEEIRKVLEDMENLYI
ncbi:conserved Plasmodium protein, unknown function [Plasmodium reichenowi]|uniref:Uncharacterized protein n=1 Tax=Plasmodium reichenowi TaxID=5854 RepID=A0A2P9D6X0_PLARE|nr:conserved Plasmodium protein, unknown function [Plasmodium reichenowi]